MNVPHPPRSSPPSLPAASTSPPRSPPVAWPRFAARSTTTPPSRALAGTGRGPVGRERCVTLAAATGARSSVVDHAQRRRCAPPAPAPLRAPPAFPSYARCASRRRWRCRGVASVVPRGVPPPAADGTLRLRGRGRTCVSAKAPVTYWLRCLRLRPLSAAVCVCARSFASAADICVCVCVGVCGRRWLSAARVAAVCGRLRLSAAVCGCAQAFAFAFASAPGSLRWRLRPSASAPGVCGAVCGRLRLWSAVCARNTSRGP
jgi:hypothetical protein